LNRALPHVKAMMAAIRRMDREMALASGNAALAAMNGSVLARASTVVQVAETRTKEAIAAPPQKTPARKHRLAVQKKTPSRRVRGAGSA
jgi:hypothetical protein